MSRYRAHYEICDQILLSVRKLFSESCCLVSVGRPIWREVGSVIFHSQSTVIYQYLRQAFMLHVFYTSAIYIQYIQRFTQSRLSTADYALLVIISSNYRNSLDTWTFIYKWPLPSLGLLCFLCGVAPCQILRTFSFSWLWIISACPLHNFVM
jgi:hypothetical protein